MEDLRDYEIVRCTPEGVATTRSDPAEDDGVGQQGYGYEEGADEEAGDEDSETYYDEDDVLFMAVVNITEEVPIGENQWNDLGQGILRVIYDDDIFGHVIHLSDAETDTIFAETIIAVQTSLRETGLSE